MADTGDKTYSLQQSKIIRQFLLANSRINSAPGIDYDDTEMEVSLEHPGTLMNLPHDA